MTTAARTHAVLSREQLASGQFEALIRSGGPHLEILSDRARAASLAETLATRPPGDVWVFGYGSLIWNPGLHSVERRPARIAGWRRDFCLTSTVGRGSAANPGLVLALTAGDSCTGLAYRLDEATLNAELDLLWRREMVLGSYIPRWVEVADLGGQPFGWAIAFTANPASNQYAGGLTQAEVAGRIARARGALGSAADYLFQTCDALRAAGAPDLALEALADLVRAQIDGAAPAL